jgi:hypothetical protein
VAASESVWAHAVTAPTGQAIGAVLRYPVEGLARRSGSLKPTLPRRTTEGSVQLPIENNLIVCRCPSALSRS